MSGVSTMRDASVAAVSRAPSRPDAFVFPCAGETLVGIVHPGAAEARVGVLVVVGGPQYRVGSHRQFTLLARDLADGGYPCMRFDYRGMGDSTGPMRTFEDVGDDLRAAIDAFLDRVPGLASVVLWGLCDGASAIAFYASRDPRVRGVVLLNPWVRSEQGAAQAMVGFYYRRRLLDPAFWRKALTGGLDLAGSWRAFVKSVRLARGRRAPGAAPDGTAVDAALPLPERMGETLGRADVDVLVVLSGDDLTAEEFRRCRGSARWTRIHAGGRVVTQELPEADHTFSRAEWRASVSRFTLGWLDERRPSWQR